MISTMSNRNPSEWDTAGGVDKQPSKDALAQFGDVLRIVHVKL